MDSTCVSERTLYGGPRRVGRTQPEGRATPGFGVHRRADTHRMRIAMGLGRRSGAARHAAHVGRQLQAVADILRAQGKETTFFFFSENSLFFFHAAWF